MKKTVAGADNDGEPEDEEKTIYFRFEATVNGISLPAGTPYTVERTGSVEAVTRFVGVMPEGEDYSFAQVGVTLGENQFVLADGETALFKDAGMIGDSVVVTEVDNTTQIYPADKGAYQDTFSEECAEASFVNGDPGSLLIGKEYAGLDEIGNAAVDDLQARSGGGLSSGFKESGLFWGKYGDKESVEVVLEITDEEGTYTWPEVPVTVKAIDRNGKEKDITFEPGDSITLNPFETIIIPTGEGTGIPLDAEYTLIETEESRKRIVQYVKIFELETENGMSYQKSESYWLQVSQSVASDVLAKPETVSARPSAVICNEVKSIGRQEDGSRRGKRMTTASEEVPEGKKLVWRVERYDQGSGVWFPAKEIEYVIFNAGVSGEETVSREVEYTKEDGRITLYKQQGDGLPYVWFPKELVYLNLYSQADIERLSQLTEEGKDLLRLVEVPEESDEEWGLLVAYQGLKPRSRAMVQHNLNLEGMDVPPEYAQCFVNSNSKTAVEIEKYVKAGSDALFTMILEQVISTSFEGQDAEQDRLITKDNYQHTITATRPGAGIPYTVYDVDGGAVGSGVTGSGGELQLEAGQYVSLEVPDNTMWTVYEKTSASPNYRLADLQPESGDGRLTKLNDNLMLINLPVKMVPVKYAVEWYSKDGKLLSRETRVGNAGYAVFVGEQDKLYGNGEGYVFDEDNEENVLVSMLDLNYPTTLKLYFNQAVEYKVFWYDVEGNPLKGEESKIGIAGDWVYATAADKVIAGYVFDAENESNITGTQLVSGEENVLRLYFNKAVDYTIKVQYLVYSGKEWKSEKIADLTKPKMQGIPGQTISAAELSENNPAWKWYTIDGNDVEFRLSKVPVSITLSEDANENVITLIYERKAHDVRYVDGVADVTVFPDERYADCLEGDLPPAYEEDTPEREGYDFVGWSPDVNKAISHENARYYEGEGWVIEYQAQWKEKQ